MKKHHKESAHSRNLYVYKPVCPNAAAPSYFTDKMLDALTAVVAAMGFVTAMVFLVAVS